MKKRPTPHLQRKRNKRLRNARHRSSAHVIKIGFGKFARSSDRASRSMEKLALALANAGGPARLWGRAVTFPAREVSVSVHIDASPFAETLNAIAKELPASPETDNAAT